jgi:ParB family chromosome partitioning protein
LLDDFSCTQEELATRIGRSRPQVTNTLRLLKLPASVQKRVAAGVLSAGHAKALGGVADAAVVDVLAVRVVAEGLSVRALEEIIAVGGVGGSARKKQRTVKPTSTDFPEVAEQLAHALDKRVTIQKPKGNKPGSIAIEFADAEDLARVAAQLRS